MRSVRGFNCMDLAMKPTTETGPGWELRAGDWREVLADVVADSVITDPPYSPRTHSGQRSNKYDPADGLAAAYGSTQQPISYGHITPADAEALAARWSAARWLIVFGDHISAQWHEAAAKGVDRYTFPPVPWVKPDAAPRFMGDGPSPAHETITISRVRARMRPKDYKHRPGYYSLPCRPGRAGGLVGAKPPDLMGALIRDYSQPGDLIVDPYAGSATTLLAALRYGRRAIGAERDPETFKKAVERLRKGFTPCMFAAVDKIKAAQDQLPW